MPPNPSLGWHSRLKSQEIEIIADKVHEEQLNQRSVLHHILSHKLIILLITYHNRGYPSPTVHFSGVHQITRLIQCAPLIRSSEANASTISLFRYESSLMIPPIDIPSLFYFHRHQGSSAPYRASTRKLRNYHHQCDLLPMQSPNLTFHAFPNDPREDATSISKGLEESDIPEWGRWLQIALVGISSNTLVILSLDGQRDSGLARSAIESVDVPRDECCYLWVIHGRLNSATRTLVRLECKATGTWCEGRLGESWSCFFA